MKQKKVKSKCFFNLLKYDKFYYNINLILRLEHVTLII